ncbi:AAA family ATPase [Pseudomonas viridiflava]|uniref:AAA family ATPase n=1 Tax=Pseudomonas viridiflava TaxID=33069 RepID=UPI002EB9EA9B|nr:AAA family ATPase [Pseudomonas viridiflava]
MNILITRSFKSIPSELEFDLPNFSILTGRNGSGKTHLLEAMSSEEMAKIHDNGQHLTKITYIAYNQLNYSMVENTDISEINAHATGLWNQIQSLKEQFQMRKFQTAGAETLTNYIFKFVDQRAPIVNFIKSTMLKSGKDKVEDLTSDDVHEHLSFSDGNNDTLLTNTLAKIFKTYHFKWSKNLFKEFLKAREISPEAKYLGTADFQKIHGAAPWTLINEILERAELPYFFPAPSPEHFDLPFQLRLVDRTTNETVSINDLSSGEKVLMSLAVAIYSTDISDARPDLLLLDEPDAPLHPCYSQLLIEILHDIIVKREGIRVVMTTHSPATVALAPEDCLFEVQRDNKYPRKLSKLDGVAVLTKGLSNLRVSYDRRRPVFVESIHDVTYYETLFRILSTSHDFNYIPIFMPPHSRVPKETNQHSSNCQDVKNIVTALQSSGNDLSWGVIDHDNVNRRDGQILVVGEERRYSIENYLLDPLYVIFGLIRIGKTFDQVGLQGLKIRYTEISKISVDQCQTIVNDFLSQVGYDLRETEQVHLLNGYQLEYPRSFLRDQGHAYEDKLFKTFNPIKELCKGQTGPALKLRVLKEIEEHPQFMPTEILELFQTLSGE